MRKLIVLLLGLSLLFTGINQIHGQSISFGPSIPAASANTVSTCSGGSSFTVEIANGPTHLTSVWIELRLNAGINYIPGSFTFTSTSVTILEHNISDLNNPFFKMEGIPPGEEISLTIQRVGTCAARDLKINGATFSDSTFVYAGGSEVSYNNGLGAGVANYDAIYASLSINNVTTTPTPTNIQGSTNRSMEITNGSFGSIDTFTFVESFLDTSMTFSNFRINPNGINYAIPASHINIKSDSIYLYFSSTEIMAIDGSAGSSGNGDGLFDLDEQFILSYDITPIDCSSGSNLVSDLSVFWGCNESVCQSGTSVTSLAIVNATPIIDITNVVRPTLDMCGESTYGMTITNNTEATIPAGGSYAKDVTIYFGVRQNYDLITTSSSMEMTSPSQFGLRVFSNYQLNGNAVTLPTVAGKFGFPVDYIAANHFAQDPDGPGGLEDLDGDGYYDDLAKDASFNISFDVSPNFIDANCGLGRFDYSKWEHISADLNWFNQCDVLMTPVRQEFDYSNTIRDYIISTDTEGPTDVVDQQFFESGIRPYLYSNMTCNGEDYNTGSDVNWIVRAILPPGIIVDPSYDQSKFNISGDTIFTEGKYVHEFTRFPLQADCASWNNVNPVNITFETVYECKSGGSNCFTETVHCYNQPLVFHCGTNCAGVSSIEFSTLRTSKSWTNNTQSTLVDINGSGIERNVVYPGDTVEFSAQAVLVDTMTDSLYLRINYTLGNATNIFDFVDGTVNIVDFGGAYNGGQTHYTLPLNTAPTINNLGSNQFEMIYDLSAYKSSIDANFMYGEKIGGPGLYESDSILVTSNFVINSSMSAITDHHVENFRAEYFIVNNGQEHSCSSWGSQLSYQKVSVYLSNTNVYTNGCNQAVKRFYLTHSSGTGDDHPNEYRPIAQVDSAYITLPSGYLVDSVRFLNDVTMISSDYNFDGSILKVYRPANYVAPDKRSTYYPKISVYLKATCTATSGTASTSATYYFKDKTYLSDAALHEPVALTAPTGNITYSGPSFNIIPHEVSKEILDNQTSWVVDLCNSSSSSDIDFNWITLSSNTGNITVDSIHNLTSGTSVPLSVITRLDGSFYFELGKLELSSCAVFEIFGTVNSCTQESLNINHGWACEGYMNPEDAIICSTSNVVNVSTKVPQISTNITPLTTTPTDPNNPSSGNWNSNSVNMCEPFPTEVRLVNAQPGNLYNPQISIVIPSSGNGLDYVANSMRIEVEGVDAPGTTRAIGAAAEAILVAASAGNNSNWNIALSDLDPSNFGNGEPLLGTDNIIKNEITLRWTNSTTCDISSGDFFVISVHGTDYCGNAAAGSGENVNGFPIDIFGIVPSYNNNITASIIGEADLKGCDDTKSINVDLFITGGNTQTTDTLVITLPEGVEYGAGFICNTPGKCPTYVSSTLNNNLIEVRFAYSSGWNGNIDFDFDLNGTTYGDCDPNTFINIKSENTLPPIACGGGTCPTTKAITGSATVDLSVSKPNLGIAFLSSSYTGPTNNPTINYNIQVDNTGFTTENNVILDFYCLNAAGDDIIGGIIAKDTVENIIAKDGSEIITNSITCNCDPTQGIVAIITPAYDNCYCDALPSMASKSPGLTEIPHTASSSIVLPVELYDFNLSEEQCDITVEWITLSESNSSHFIVQRSYDGLRYSNVKIISAAGYSTSRNVYKFIDQGRNSSEKIYYRLMQVDFDGTEEIFPAKELHRTECDELENSLEIQPNLLGHHDQHANIIFYNNRAYSKANIKIYSFTGQLVTQLDEVPLFDDRNDISLELENLDVGGYQVVMEVGKGKIFSGRIVKIDN